MPNEIKIYGIIGEDVRSSDVKQQLATMDQTEPLICRINSEGGAVSDGLAIYDAFASYAGPKKAIIESMAFSAASHIAMAFEEIEITENGYLMIHNPHMEVEGDDKEHAKAAQVLAMLKDSMVGAYARKTGKSSDEVLAIMQNTTWLNAERALSQGFVNRILPPKPLPLKAVARLKSMPQGVVSALCGADSEAGEHRDREESKSMSTNVPVAASLAEIKAAFPKAKAEFIVSCLEKNLPLASVMSEALAALEEENQSLKAQLAEAMAKASAEPAAMEVEVEDDKEEMVAKAAAKNKAKPKGVAPVAVAQSSSRPSARLRWQAALNDKIKAGLDRSKAAAAVNRENPGLREEMVNEANS